MREWCPAELGTSSSSSLLYRMAPNLTWAKDGLAAFNICRAQLESRLTIQHSAVENVLVTNSCQRLAYVPDKAATCACACANRFERKLVVNVPNQQ